MCKDKVKSKVFVSKYYYFIYEALWILLCILIPIYFVAVIFSFEFLIIRLEEMFVEYLLWGLFFIGIRDFVTAHIFLYFSHDNLCLKKGYLTGMFLGYTCYDLKSVSVQVKKYFGCFEVLKIDLQSQTIRLNNLMFSKNNFQKIKEQLAIK